MLRRASNPISSTQVDLKTTQKTLVDHCVKTVLNQCQTEAMQIHITNKKPPQGLIPTIHTPASYSQLYASGTLRIVYERNITKMKGKTNTGIADKGIRSALQADFMFEFDLSWCTQY